MSKPDPLFDAAPATEPVPLGPDRTLDVRGISFREIAAIARRFPEIRDLVGGDGVELTLLLDRAPDAATAIMAAAAGRLGDQVAEQVIDSLPVETQFAIFEAIVRQTFPGGFGPFVDRLKRLASSLNAVAAAPAVSGAPSSS